MSQVMARALVILSLIFTVTGVGVAADHSSTLPNPVIDEPPARTGSQETAVLAGGCFWGVQAVFQHVKGVSHVTSGYSGGNSASAEYEVVSSGDTGHAESVEIKYDPAQISYGQLLKVFFSVAHDPTQLDRQGPDTGKQYRSAIFYGSDEQKRIAQAYISQLEQTKAFDRPIVTQVVALKKFYPAEAYHQDYASHHPNDPYIAFNDRPKVERLRQEWPQLYK